MPSKFASAIAASVATQSVSEKPAQDTGKSTSSEPEKWSKTTIAEKLQSDDAWLRRGILAIYSRQTDFEQTVKSTKEHNGIGFNGLDAKFLSSIAEQIQRGRTLSPKQIAVARKKMHKYAQQLADIANGKR